MVSYQGIMCAFQSYTQGLEERGNLQPSPRRAFSASTGKSSLGRCPDLSPSFANWVIDTRLITAATRTPNSK